ncbi:MAG: hypothetical protein JWP38_3716 [Herbaspirillum sp.]|nr:hypothetical protein [Herbaspirillum sp.]
MIPIKTGFQLAQQGAETAAAHADRIVPDCSTRALAVFLAYAEHHSEFTTEDVIVSAVTLPAPVELRAWGHVALQAKKQGAIVSIGHCCAKQRKSHARPVTQWRSLICQAVAA